MPGILTLTLNPSIDVASQAETVRPTHKARTAGERCDPGGGGINVARVRAWLGSEVLVLYLAGGVTAPVLAGLRQRCGTPHPALPIAGDTRISLAVHASSSGREFRCVPQGPVVSAAEWQQCLQQLLQTPCRWRVLTGSLPQGVSSDFYARVVTALRPRGVQLGLDTSGPALKATPSAWASRAPCGPRPVACCACWRCQCRRAAPWARATASGLRWCMAWRAASRWDKPSSWAWRAARQRC